MQWLTSFFAWLAGPFTSLPPQRRRRVLFWGGQVVLVLLAVVVLTLVNNLTGIDRVLRTRAFGLNRAWLPLVFLVGYALFWLMLWMWHLLGPDREAGEFADIESAWAGASRQLAEAGVDLCEAPVFLVLGRTAGSLEDVFAAARVPLLMRHAPRDDAAPLHVYASREAVFVACDGASLLGAQAARLTQAADPPGPRPVEVLGGEQAPASEELAPATAAAPAPAGAVLLLGEPEPAPGDSAERRPALIRDEQAVDLQTRRLRHVCRLLVRDRQPYCPANGIVVLLPLAATASDEDASETASVVQHDLAVARAALQMDCPRLAVLGDAEQLPGFAEVAQHFPDRPGEACWVLGQHFPLMPDVPAAEVAVQVEQGIRWVADGLLPAVVGRLWRREGEPGVAGRESALEANIHLYGFLRECRVRLFRLARLVSRGMLLEGAARPYFGGAYVAGTGPDARDQGFLAGVVRRAMDQQNAVGWSDDARRDDDAFTRYAWVGYALLAAFVAAVALILWAW